MTEFDCENCGKKECDACETPFKRKKGKKSAARGGLKKRVKTSKTLTKPLKKKRKK
jgi:hypothetical protein